VITFALYSNARYTTKGNVRREEGNIPSFSQDGGIPWVAKKHPASQEEHVFLLRRADRFWQKWSMLVKTFGKKKTKEGKGKIF